MANDFWDFSLAVYAAPGVEDECLALQDEFGIDVNLLLFGAYMGGHGIGLSRDEMAQISALVEAWQRQVVMPLRGVRRATKPMLQTPPGSAGKPIEALRNKIKAIELESERIEQDLLDEWARTCARLDACSDIEAAIHGNIRLLLELSGAAGGGARYPATLIAASLVAAKSAGAA